MTLRDRFYRLFTARSLGLKEGNAVGMLETASGTLQKCAGHKICKLGSKFASWADFPAIKI